MEEIRLGNIYGATGGNFAGWVYDKNGLCPTINTGGGGDRQPMTVDIVAMRGRDGEKNKWEQQLEIRDDGVTNAITTVQKDNLLLIKQNTKSGYIPCEVGGIADLSYPDSKTRRGRVIENGTISPTLMTENIPSVLEKWTWEIDGETYLIRIRKLTPRECGRLMGVSDKDIDAILSVNSNSQAYKQFGNSIVVDVLCNIFKQLL